MYYPKNKTEKVSELMTGWRRDLHMIPEVGFDVKKTCGYLRSVLNGMDCSMIPAAKNGLCAFFDFGRTSTVAYRSDMDALPITEISGVPYASRHPGFMHACGHDGHMAALLGLAYVLDALGDAPSNVLLIFQPAEETTGGAKIICDSGILKKYQVDRVFGIHIWPGFEAGQPAACPGSMMAGSCEVTAISRGESSHCAGTGENKDAIRAICDFLTRSYLLPGLKVSSPPAEEDCLLKFGKIYGGSVRNAIAGHAALEGTLRCLDEHNIEKMISELRALAGPCGEKYGCTIEISRSQGYLPVYNDPALYADISSVLGEYGLVSCSPVMLTEDFSFYQREAPGIFFFLGTGENKALHSNRFDFDENILTDALEIYLRIL